MERLIAVGEDRPMKLGHLIARESKSTEPQVVLIGNLA